MKVHHDLNALPEFKNAVITIGSFDGVHKGHQEIIEQVKQLAQRCQGESVLITFHPHPRAIVYPKDTTLRLITTIEEKIELIGRYEVDHLVVVPFTVEFSQLNADEYIEKFLVGRFHPRYIVIGYDHRFGLSRQGDINFLQWYGERFGYEVVEIEKQVLEDVTVSSTKIRRALEEGDVKNAARFLGHFFLLNGKVAEGQKIGRTIGYPTANLEVSEKSKLVPPDGIYAVFLTVAGKRYRGMLYIGRRPTLKEFNNRTIEVNIFDFDADIYGQYVMLELVDFLRGDQKFNGLTALKEQLAKDKIAAEAVLLDAPLIDSTFHLENPPQVAVVVLNYNGRNYLQQFLPYLLASTYPNLEIVIADNASTDDSLEFMEEHYPQLRTIELAENHGFAEGYNQALKQVLNADYYVLLNSDIEVTPGWIEPIVQLMEADKSIAAAQPKILSHGDKSQFEYAGGAGGWLDNLGYPFCRGRVFAVTETDEGQYDATQEIFWATGAALFVRSDLFHGIGGFDGDYFAHAEEIDLCWRLKRAGYKIIARPLSKVYHVGGGTLAYNTPRKTFLNFRNTLITLMKNESAARLSWLIPARLILDGMAGALFLSQGRIDHVGAIVRAHWSFFGQWKKTGQKREKYNELVEKMRISPLENNRGRYAGSVVMAYYGKGRRRFAELED